ncbi:coiled-coil domain-containing protein 57 isoform X2 [Hemicordylus capensis]|uniref:coiled-coil domain-containing protein 57 isoform X2 n=1 Tax=Hemicordylus capensis TaxID=884348 RepID=UPI002302EFEE|nr:coiled-coil domain-containing protein 57 isoform X2 [Hemicordylus capensis]
METGPATPQVSGGFLEENSLPGPIMLYTENTFNELLICKEQELKELQAHQMHFQKTALQETQKQLEEMRRKFNKLKEDFTYNLKVLGERDKELEHYDTLFTQLKMVENVKQAEVSDLRIQVDKLQQALAREIKKQEALQYQYQQKLKEHQLELERLHSSKDLDINHHREEYENMKQQLERKLQEVEGELALQRQELLVEFDAEMKKREHEFRRKADEMSNLVLSHELKVKLLTKELEALKEAGMKAAESLKVAEATNLELEKEVKCKAWEIKDLAAVKDAKIHDLEGKLDSVQLSWKKEKETFERKHAAIDRFAREKDAILASVKEAHAEQIHKWEHQFRELQINKETLEMQLHRADWRHTDSLREKEAVIEKLKQELETLKTSWDSQVAQISKETVSKDLQIQAFQEEELKLRAQLASFLQDTESYKQQLLLAREREESLERAKVQIELDCQRRCENAERNQYQKSEALIRSLSTARDQVTAELREKEQKLHELEIVLSAVTLERDQTVQELQKHGLLSKGIKQVTLKDNEGAIQQGFPSAEIQRLQEQNITLRAVIAEMRREMETLNIQAPPSDGTNMKTQDADRMNTVAVSFTPDYVQSLEEEIRKLKEKCQAMEKQHKNATEIPGKLFVSSLNPSSCDRNTQTSHQGHISSGNSGTLHLDEIVPETALRQHEVRAPQEDSVRTQDVQVNLVTKRPQDNSVQLKQKLFDLGAGDGPYQHTGNRAKVLQSKLKEAVRKICSLSKEKQQLLEMVNRLRAELGAASKGGFKDAKSSNQPQDHTFPGTLCLKEFARETKHRLLALEHLQYQLTTQELQYAQQKHASGKCSHFVESLNNKDVPCNSSCSKEVEVPLKQESFVRNHETVVSCQYQPLRKGSTRQSQEGQLSSSGAHSSLQDIWQILEMGSSPSILSPQSNNDQEKPQVIHDAERFENWGEANADNIERAPAAALTVRGTKFDVQSKLKPNKASCSQLRKPRTSQRMTKIRNYNVKD